MPSMLPVSMLAGQPGSPTNAMPWAPVPPLPPLSHHTLFSLFFFSFFFFSFFLSLSFPHLDELALGKVPLLDVVGRGRGERVLFRVRAKRPDALLVVGQRADAAARRQIPKPHRVVV